MRKSTFKVGDTVFYPSAGVGVIESIEDVYFSGQRESCFVIRILENQMVIKLPQANIEKNGLRPLLQGKKLKELFKVLSSESLSRTSTNWTEHYKYLEHKIKGGSCLELGEVVRDLTRSKRLNGLSFEEARLLETASNYLTREVATVQGVPPEIALDHIRTYINVNYDASVVGE